MWSELGHCIFWYIDMNVLEDIEGLTLQTPSQITRLYKADDYNFESYYSAFSMYCITTIFITKQQNTSIREQITLNILR
jgi:hypothetical protein